MGTSRSGAGPASGIPLVPPWVPEPVPPTDEDGPDASGENNHEAPPTPESPSIPIAPRARFGAARTSLGAFARTGEIHEMRSALGHYVHKGLGGASTAARRMGGTTRTAGTLFGFLSASATGQPVRADSPFDPALLSGRSVDEVMDALVEAVRPVDGSQDAEASRRAIRDAISELLGRFPEADLLQLSADQRIYVVERYVAIDIYNRFVLDLGKTVHEKAPSPTAALARLKDIKDYTKEGVSSSFRALRKKGEQVGVRRITGLVHQVLRETFEVFEEYVR